MLDLSHYRLEHHIASGAQARVYSGFNKQNNKRIAAKQLILSNSNPQSHQRIMQQIMTEYNLLKLTKSPSLVKMYDIIQTETHLYLIYQQHPTDLQHFLLSNQEIPFQTIQKWSFQLVKGLLDLHFYDILHRDIKPSNILLTENSFQGDIKITDFGISKYCSEGTAQSAIGTLGFIAPEIINGQTYGTKADIYSLGKVIYIMLTSNRKKVTGIINKLSFRSGTPQQAKKFVKYCLNNNPNKRLSANSLGKTEYLKQYKKKTIKSDIFQMIYQTEALICQEELDQSLVIQDIGGLGLDSDLVQDNLKTSQKLIEFIEEEKIDQVANPVLFRSMNRIDAQIYFIKDFLTYCNKQDNKYLVYFAVWYLQDKLDSLFQSLAETNQNDKKRENQLKELRRSFKRVLKNPPKGISDPEEGERYAVQIIRIADKRVKYNRIYGLKKYLQAFLEIAVKIQPENPRIQRRVERLREKLEIQQQRNS